MNATLPGEHRSYWLSSTPPTDYPTLTTDSAADVAIVGGGIIGLTTAYALTRAGLHVTLLEANRIVSGVTGHTTGKVTSLHGLIYRDLIERHGEERARLYGDANQAAIEWIARTVAEEGIACDFARCPAYTFARQERAAEQVREEARAAERLGLPAALTEDLELPVPVTAAVRFSDQARFHPRKYLLGLADKIVAGGGRIFECTRAITVSGGDICRVRTQDASVWAPWVVLATLMPFPRRTALWTQAYPVGHAAIALESQGSPLEGMYLGVDAEPHSVRLQPGGDGRSILVLDSPGQKTGHGSTARLTSDLVATAGRTLPGTTVSNRWWTMDLMSVDRIPFVGRLNPLQRRILTATGMGAWGMTNGTAAALLLADLVQDKRNPWETLYSPARLGLSFRTLRAFAKENADAVGGHLVLPRLKRTSSDLAAVGPGEGVVVDVGGRRAAVSRDDGGNLTAVSHACTHVGCQVRWNDAERTWDCPCHGSRFTAQGRMLQGPAAQDLRPLETGPRPAPES